MLDSIGNNIPVLIANGATLLIVIIILIRVFAKIAEKFVNGITATITGLRDELIGLRRDIRDVGHENAIAVGALAERVARIEGKIEGIAMSNAPEMSDRQEVTGVTRRLEPDNVFVDDQVTPVEIPVRPTPQPASGQKRAPTAPTTYGLSKPRAK